MCQPTKSSNNTAEPELGGLFSSGLVSSAVQCSELAAAAPAQSHCELCAHPRAVAPWSCAGTCSSGQDGTSSLP